MTFNFSCLGRIRRFFVHTHLFSNSYTSQSGSLLRSDSGLSTAPAREEVMQLEPREAVPREKLKEPQPLSAQARAQSSTEEEAEEADPANRCL